MAGVPDAPRLRLSVLGVVVVSLFAALFGRLWYLQVAAAPEYRRESITTRTRSVALAPVRGRILDAQGRVLVDNQRTLVVNIDRDQIKDDGRRAPLFARLSGVLAVPAEQLEARYRSGVDDRYLPFPLAVDVTEATANYLKERGEDFPGVQVDDSWQRVYRYGPIGANVIGFTARISDANKAAYVDRGYALADRVGSAGIEKYYETELRGTPGTVTYEVDARERIVRVVDEEPAVAGNDVQLTIDVQVQELAEQTLQTALRERRTKAPKPQLDPTTGQVVRIWGNYPAPAGAVVVEDPANGAVLALASNPPFDPRWFQSSIPQDKFEQVFGEKVGSPLFDRATQGQYAPASTFKPFTAYGALKTGILESPASVLDDQGTYTIPFDRCDASKGKCTFQNAGKAANGPVDLRRALTVSSDVFFYRLGDEMYYFRSGPVLQEAVKEWGFARRTGVQLPDEAAGLIPDDETRAKAKAANPDAFTSDRFFIGDNVQLAIGQGDTLATPLQMANAYSALANGGTVWRPTVVKALLVPGTPDVAAPADPCTAMTPDGTDGTDATDATPADGTTTTAGDAPCPTTPRPTATTGRLPEIVAPGVTASPTTARPPAPGGTTTTAPPVPTRIRQVDLTQATVARPVGPARQATVEVPAEWRNPMLEGLRGVVTTGTADKPFAGFPLDKYPLAGKTGTAQDVGKENNKDSSLFTAFGPLFADQQYTVTAVLEKSGFGADAAAPVVRRMYEGLLGLAPLPEAQDYAPLDRNQKVAGVLPPFDDRVITGEGGRD